MAITNPDPTTGGVFGPKPQNIKAITTAGGLLVNLDDGCVYTLTHLQVAEDESADTNTAWVTTAENRAAADAPVAASKLTAGQLRLASGGSLTFGPGVTSMKVICAAGAPAILVTPKKQGA